jgi:hypothetical protein
LFVFECFIVVLVFLLKVAGAAANNLLSRKGVFAKNYGSTGKLAFCKAHGPNDLLLFAKGKII